MTSPASPPASADDRAQEFLAELAALHHEHSSRTVALARLGLALLAGGPVLAALALLLSQLTDNPLNQSTDLSLGLVGIALSIAGLGIFLRYSLGQFLRFWLLRLSYEVKGQNQGQGQGQGQGRGRRPLVPDRPRRADAVDPVRQPPEVAR